MFQRRHRFHLTALLIALLMLLCALPLSSAAARDTSEQEITASALKSLGLFRGVSDTDFDLNRAPTRVEALVMLIRTLGKESEALNGDWVHPFTDVPAWADKYVGYAYQNGLTNGVSATEFGAGNASAAMYITFVLRALNYSDATGDFKWDDPFTLSKGIGILPDSVDTVNFWRADVATVSFSALSAQLKNSSTTLADRLVNQSVFTLNELSAAKTLAASTVTRAADPITTEPTIYTTEEPVKTGSHIVARQDNPYLGEWYAGIGSVDENGQEIYIVNVKTGKIHHQRCGAIEDMKDENKAVTVYPELLIQSDPFFSHCKRNDD